MGNFERAKQFMPFDALKGFKEALKEKEKVSVNKKDLSEDIKEELSEQINLIEIGDKIKIVHYKNKQYNIDVGYVKEINKIQKFIIVNNTKIFFDNIFKIINLI